MQNYANENIDDLEQSEAERREYKRLKLIRS
jgi:hypothetical protein